MKKNDPFSSKVSVYQKINHILYKKYSQFKYSYSRICTNNLISYEKCRIVAKFKDFLIYDDTTEFLHEFCEKKNLASRLKYIFNFYNSYSKIYPNYLVIPENKCLYKNIRKKQRIIDEENVIKYNTPKNKDKDKKILENKKEIVFFNKSIIESINKLNKSSNTKNNSSKELNLNNIISSMICSDIKKSRNLNNDKKSYNINLNNNIDKNKNIYEFNDISLNTQSSSILKNDFFEDNTKSKASITEILNLINGKKNNINNNNKNKNGSLNTLNNIKYDKIKSSKNKKLKFIMLDINYIKKNIKTYKPKLSHNNNIKAEDNITNNSNNKIIMHKHKQTVSCLIEDLSKVQRNKNRIIQRRQKYDLNKFSNNKINKKEYYSHNCFAVKTLTNFGNVFNRKNKIVGLKNIISTKNKYNIKRKSNDSKKNKFFFSLNTVNSTFNLGNTFIKINSNNDNINHKNLQKNNIKTNKHKAKNNQKTKKPIETLISLGSFGRKSQLFKEKDLKKVFRLESDSFLSTQVSLNKKQSQKTKSNYSCVDNILTQAKSAIKSINFNNKHNITLSSFSKKYNTEYCRKNKDKNFKEKITSYDCKPFHDYSKQNYFTKIKLKKQRTSTLIKNNKILNIFTSKDFYDLKINKINSSNITANFKDKKNKTLKKEKIYKDLNTIDSHSFLLKTFNKEKNKDYKLSNKNNEIHLNANKFKKYYIKNLCVHTSKQISYGKTDMFWEFKKMHKKNNTTNICKNIEEIEKMKMKNEKNLKTFLNGQKNIIKINSLNRNNNIQLKFKTPCKTLLKSLEINNKTMNNKIGINTNTNFKSQGFTLKSKYNMNKPIFHLKL